MPTKNNSNIKYKINTHTIYSLDITLYNITYTLYPYHGPIEDLTKEDILTLLFNLIKSIKIFPDPDPDSFILYRGVPGGMLNPILELPYDQNEPAEVALLEKLKNFNNEDPDFIIELITYFFNKKVEDTAGE